MSNELFIALAALAGGTVLAWGFKRLPGEGGQFLACLPRGKEADGRWRGVNLTWYGLLLANAQAAAAALFLLLLSSLGVAWAGAAAAMAAMIALCLAGSRWLAQLVERKGHTFTVGGASFLGLLTAPLIFGLAQEGLARLGRPGAPLISWLAALVCAHALGEGLGRLGCVSFGCCYGKPLDQCPPRLARLLGRVSFVFHGATKKAAYAGGLEGRPVIAVQAMTAVIHLAAALAGAYLFLEGNFPASLLVCGLVTQLWRVASEFLRADYRGGGRFSAYQWMALADCLLLAALAWFLSAPNRPEPDLELGLAALWSPGPLLMLQAIWLACFAYYGRSRVTGSSLSFFVHRHLI